MTKTIIDVSSHNGVVDWAKVKTDGVMIRLGYRGYGQGTLTTDTQFYNNVNGCIKYNIPFGVYFFSTAINEAEGKTEADYVLAKIKGYKLTLPIFIDSEYSNAKKTGRSDWLSRSARTSAVMAFCERIKDAGHPVGVYASESWFKTELDVSSLPYMIWCAKYSSKAPTYPDRIDAWQYTSTGSMAGISGNVDHSHWYTDFSASENPVGVAVSAEAVKKDIVPVSYLQTDAKWKNNKYGIKDETSTIGSAGCGPTCAAMVIASLADPSVTPATTAKWSMDHGYKAYHQGTYYSYFAPQMSFYNIQCTQMNYNSIYHGAGSAKSINSKALESVKAGNWIIACMGKGDWTSSGHFVLWYGVDGNNALIRDPNSTKSSRVKAPISTFQNQVKYYFEVKVPVEMVKTDTPKEEEKEMTKEEIFKLMDEWYEQRGHRKPAKDLVPYLDWAYEKGIMTGGSYERPATRTEVCIVLKRLYDIIQEEK